MGVLHFEAGRALPPVKSMQNKFCKLWEMVVLDWNPILITMGVWV
jgi:hypothetical protein